MILKVFDNDIEDIIEDFHDLIENVLYMISFENFVKGEKDNIIKWLQKKKNFEETRHDKSSMSCIYLIIN